MNKLPINDRSLKLGCLGCAITFAMGLGGLLLVAPNWFDNHNPFMQQPMIDVAWQWGNFAPLPSDPTDLQISTSGSSFSRTFSGSFSAKQPTFKQWLQDSPGLNFNQGTQLESGIIRYTISPSNGAGFGTVDFDPKENMIYFTISWS